MDECEYIEFGRKEPPKRTIVYVGVHIYLITRMQAIFEDSKDYYVEYAEDAPEGIEKILKHRPNVVLIEHDTPPNGAIALIDQLIQRKKFPEIILVGGDLRAKARRRYRHRGVRMFLSLSCLGNSLQELVNKAYIQSLRHQ